MNFLPRILPSQQQDRDAAIFAAGQLWMLAIVGGVYLLAHFGPQVVAFVQALRAQP